MAAESNPEKMGGSLTEPTLGEVMRRFDEFDARHSKQFDELSAEVKAIPARIDETFVRQVVYDVVVGGLRKEIAEIKSRSEWLVRTVGGIIIVGVVGLLFGVSR